MSATRHGVHRPLFHLKSYLGASRWRVHLLSTKGSIIDRIGASLYSAALKGN
jgi:hypothetical protein